MLSIRYNPGAAAAALILVAVMATPNGARAEIKHYRFGVWQLAINHDSFGGANGCKLTGPDLSYQAGVVTLHFNPHTDTEDAWYRIDGGPVAQAKRFTQTVEARTRDIDPGPLENPSAGLVSFPVEAIKDAAAIDVRPNAAAGVKHFRLNGLAAATAFMQERKCVDYSW